MNPSSTPDRSETSAAGSRQVARLLAHYGESHQNPTNELLHFIAIPLIMLSLLGMMFALHPCVAYLFIAASMVYYLRLSLVFLATMVLWSAILLALVHAMGARVLPLSLAIFVGAWILQFVGHKLEGQKPSLFEDIQSLWVGPLFVLSKLFVKLGIRW